MPADTYTSDGVGVQLMGTGNDNNTWGSNANTNVFQIFADAIANALVSTVTGGTLDLSGTPPPAAPSQARYAGLIFTGVLGSNQIVQVPNFSKWWMVANATSGAFTLKFKTPAGSASLAVPQNGGWQMVYCDGANGFVVFPFNTQQIAMPDGSAAAPPYSNVNETNSGWRRAGTQDWRFTINGTDVLQITGAGASSPSVVNILAPQILQVGGAQVLPAGILQPYDGIELPNGGWLWADGSAISRTTFATLFAAVTKVTTGNTHTSTTIDNVAVDLTKKGLVGAFVEGTGVQSGTTVTAITSTTLTLSLPTTSTNTGVSLRLLPYGQGDGSTTFNIRDAREYVMAGRGDMNASVDPGRLTLAVAGFDPTSLAGKGGAQQPSITVGQANLPNVTLATTIAAGQGAHNHVYLKPFSGGSQPVNLAAGSGGDPTAVTSTSTLPAMSGTTPLGGSGTAIPVLTVQPTAICNFIIKT